MTDLRLAAQAALDALSRVCNEQTCAAMHHKRNEYHMAGDDCPAVKTLNAAKDNLRAALAAQPAPVQPVDKGPWIGSMDGRHIYSDDFEHDVMLKVDGDFADDAHRTAYSDALAARLNATMPAAPVQGEPLSDEQITELAQREGDETQHAFIFNSDGRWSVLSFARAIEAHHGIGGQGGAQ